jgi:phage terminase Nu1 subunit (DNA packaging protein)
MAAKADKIDITIVNSVTLGHVWGITDRRVRQLVEEGVIETVARGKYNLVDATRRYCAFLRQSAEAGADKKNAKLSYDEEHAAHEKVKREKAELQLKVMKGELHRSEDVEEVMTDMITRAKTKLLGLPSKVAPRVMGYKELTKIQAVLQMHIEEALAELADYSPELFANDDVIQDDDNDE